MSMHGSRTAARWLGWGSRVFLSLAALALVCAVAGMIVSGTVFKAPRGCEECVPHITVVVLTIMLLLASFLCGIVGTALYLASVRAVQVRRGHAASNHGRRARPRRGQG
jgi:heme/copper-type cytochrome/quinol oxidase subunit 3